MPTETNTKPRYEVTEAKLFSNLEILKNEVATLGAEFKPPNPFAQPATFNANLAQAVALLAALRQKQAEEEQRRNTREDLYEPLATLCGEIATYCEAAGWAANDVANLRSMVREMRGKRAKPVEPTGEGETPPKTVSASQTSFVSRADHLRRFIEILRANEANFKPEVEKYKIATLEAMLADLESANSTVAAAETATSQARAALDAVLYTSPANLVDAAKSIKKYVGSVFKTTQVNQNIKGLTFEKPRRVRHLL